MVVFDMKLFYGIIFVVLLAIPLLLVPLWIESSYDTVSLWLTPPSQKGLRAANIALERAGEITEQDLSRVYAVQELLTVIEQNLDVPGNPYKALRTLQETEGRLRALQDMITGLREYEGNSEQYALVLQHASIRIDLILQEIEFAKEKTRAKIE